MKQLPVLNKKGETRPASPSNQFADALIFFGSAVRQYVDPMTALVEQDLSIDERKQRPIAARAYILTGNKSRATLPHQNAACCNVLASKALHAEAFANTVASVSNASLTFLMCHKPKP
jgi:hypothetical protein